ncbi:29 kDa ribonucleoprotein, chloroplastic [Quillaja saponaria]|uniref:29 kDa ribonucleoprotein, chloroplastic n=1 Tax=Quillaja saponaria TaxID=32244 RepID=A0AAD7VDY8_QUISA|nr:29 kDa ribonucleoprotein, chloroplastic [Quillaja saponaria]
MSKLYQQNLFLVVTCSNLYQKRASFSWFKGQIKSKSLMSKLYQQMELPSLCSFLSSSIYHFQHPFSLESILSIFDQEEEVSNDGEDCSFSRDLKLFVGNLPFSVNNVQLTDLFEIAGNIEKVEVLMVS